jgi:signal transduction histidine kinase
MLAHSRASLNVMIENVGMTIYSLDRNFRYMHFNTFLKQSIKQVYNIDIKVGDVIFDFLYRDDPTEAEEWKALYTRALGGESLQFVKEFVVRGYHSFFKFFINPIKEGADVTGLTCLAIDISKERQEESQKDKIARELVHRNQSLEQYSYIIAHNLRGPIANLLGIANLLELPGVSASDKAQATSHVLQSAKRLDDVVRDLNDILRAREEINVHRESVSFDDIVDDIKESISCVVESSGVKIMTEFSSPTGMITVKGYLHSIFYNLITNSIKYSRPGTKPVIKINSEYADGKVRLTFSDDGLGLDLESHGDKIFGLYRRFHPHIAEGKGLGLFMVKTHVESLGGTVSIKSEVGEGTTVTIEI